MPPRLDRLLLFRPCYLQHKLLGTVARVPELRVLEEKRGEPPESPVFFEVGEPRKMFVHLLNRIREEKEEQERTGIATHAITEAFLCGGILQSLRLGHIEHVLRNPCCNLVITGAVEMSVKWWPWSPPSSSIVARVEAMRLVVPDLLPVEGYGVLARPTRVLGSRTTFGAAERVARISVSLKRGGRLGAWIGVSLKRTTRGGEGGVRGLKASVVGIETRAEATEAIIETWKMSAKNDGLKC
ncbi:hypothetical protein C8R44DRAFT_747570 [Mycena epipterygia]|nr:hypothetical protein C8R44DRAFT_747570 [Mycena epipterygia]